MKKLLLFLLTTLTVIVAVAQDDGYYYRGWTSEAHVSANNTWTVAEKLDVTFLEQSRGIFRYIQLESGARRNMSKDEEAPRIEYKTYRADVQIKYTQGGETKIVENDENHCTMVRWGDIDHYISGDHSYLLAYSYQYPDDRVEARDYLFHSLLPSNVTSHIQCFRFSVTFEKPLPTDIADRLHIYCGPTFSEEEANVQDLIVTPTQISGTLHNLPAGYAVTFYAELPEGYYDNPLKTPAWPAWLMFFLTLGLGLRMIYHECYDHNPSYTKSIEFYPPKELTPIMVGKIIDESTDDVDVAAMLPWLAQNGYISITVLESKSGRLKSSSKNQERLKLTLLDKGQAVLKDQSSYLYKLIRMIFKNGNEQILDEMKNRVTQLNDVKSSVDKMFTNDMRLSTTHHSKLMWALIVCSSLSIACASPMNVLNGDLVIVAWIWGIAFALAWGVNMLAASKDIFRRQQVNWSFYIFRLFMFAVILMLIRMGINDVCYGDTWYGTNLMAFLALICYAACELSARNNHYTEYKARMAGKLLGLREFIDTAEKDRLKMLLDDDPEYFYKILPYAMIFGLTDKWTNLFEQYDLPMQSTSWYNASSTASHIKPSQITHMTKSINDGIKTAGFDHSTHSSSGSYSGGGSGYHSSSHSSYSSGRGYSGGGGGGGGAGRW